MASGGRTHMQAEQAGRVSARVAVRKAPVAGRLQVLQQAVGNRGMGQLVSHVLARVKWVSETVSAAALPARLRAAYDLAVANPTTLPPQPAWVRTVVRKSIAYDKQRIDWAAEYNAKAQPQWAKLGPQGQARYGNDINVFAASGRARPEAAFVHGLDLRVVSIAGEFKWNADFENKNKYLPDLPPGQGYHEYYAEPEDSQVGPEPDKGTWGKNRIVRGDDGTWWATDDHYENYKKVVA